MTVTTSMQWGRGRGSAPETERRRRQARVGAELAELMATPAPGRWAEDGVCREVDPELWFPVGRRGSAVHAEQTDRARRVCAGCPVRAQCLAYALETDQAGVWGGLDEDERRALRRGSGEEAA